MARLLRLFSVGTPQHVIQRGNNRQVCFNAEEDFAAYANWLREYSIKYKVAIHAWVFMTNHVGVWAQSRQASYRALFRHHLDQAALDEIRETVNKGLVLGSERFKSEIEANLERRVRPGKVGRKRRTEMLL